MELTLQFPMTAVRIARSVVPGQP